MPDNGALQLQAVGRRFRQLATFQNVGAAEGLGPGRSLRAQLLAAIRAGTKPAVEATRQAARNELPKAGGLNEYVATSLIGSYTRLTGPRVGVRIGVRKGPGSHKAWGANIGIVRHPVFGHRDRKWGETRVTPGWFDHTLSVATPGMAAVVTKAMELVAEELTRRGV